MNLEHQGIGQLANIVEAPLGANLLDPGDAGFVESGRQTGNQREGDGKRGNHSGPVPAHEF